MSQHNTMNSNQRRTGKPNRKSVLITVAGVFAFAAGAQAQDQVTRYTGSDGSKVTLHSGQPQPNQYGPPPAFA